jgi:hypothetical protein
MSDREFSVAVPGSRRRALRCPDCSLLITSPVNAVGPRYCPRCLARGSVAVSLEPLSTGTARDETSRVPTTNKGIGRSGSTQSMESRPW